MATKTELAKLLKSMDAKRRFWKEAFRLVAEKFDALPPNYDESMTEDSEGAAAFIGWVGSKLGDIKTASQDAVNARELLEAERKYSKSLEETFIRICNTTGAWGAMGVSLTPEIVQELPNHVEQWGRTGPREQLNKTRQSLGEMTNGRDAIQREKESLQRLLAEVERERDNLLRKVQRDRTSELSSEVSRLEVELSEACRKLEKRTSQSLILAGRLKKLTRATRIAMAALAEED